MKNKILRRFTAFLCAAVTVICCMGCNSAGSSSSEKQQEQQKKQFIFYDTDYVSVKEYGISDFDGNIVKVTSRKTTWIRFFENGQIEISEQIDKYVDGAWQIGQRGYYEYGWYLIVKGSEYMADVAIKAIFWMHDYQSTENAMLTGIKLAVYDDGKTLHEAGFVLNVGEFTLAE